VHHRRVALRDQRDDFVHQARKDGFSLLRLIGRRPPMANRKARVGPVPPFACDFVSQEPQASIRLAKKVDLVAGELDTSHTQIGDRLDPLERKSDPQVLIGEQRLNNRSNVRL
jgi:hypothetical protein